jgi:hypothetical protein
MRLAKEEKLAILISTFETQRIKFKTLTREDGYYHVEEISDTISQIGILDIELAFKMCEKLMEDIHDWKTNHAWGYSIQRLCKKNTVDKVVMMIADNPKLFQVYFNETVVTSGHPKVISQYIKMDRLDLADAAFDLIYSNKNYPGRDGEDDRFFDTLGSMIHWLVFTEGIDNIDFLLHWANSIKETKDRAYALINILHLIKDIYEKRDVLMEVFIIAKAVIKYEDRFEVSTLVGQAILVDVELAFDIWSYFITQSTFEKEYNSNNVISYAYTDTTQMILEELVKITDSYTILLKINQNNMLKKICISPEVRMFPIQCQLLKECMREKDYKLAGDFIEGIFRRIDFYVQQEEYIYNNKTSYIAEVVKLLQEFDENTFHFLINIVDGLKDDIEIVKAKVYIARFLEKPSEREQMYFDCFEAIKNDYRRQENKEVLDLLVEIANFDINIALKMLEYRILHLDRKKYRDYLLDYDRYMLDTLEDIYTNISSQRVVNFILSNSEIFTFTFKYSMIISKLHNKLITDMLNSKEFQLAERALTMIKYHHIKFDFGKLIRHIIVNSHLNKKDHDIKQFLYDFVSSMKKQEERQKAFIKSYFKDVITR